MAPRANGQRVTRSRSRRQKAVTSTISGGIQQNVHTVEHSVQQDSDQQDLLDSAVTKNTRSNRQGKKVQMPEGSPINKSRDTGITPPARFHPSQSTKTEKTNLVPPTEKRKTRKKLSPATSGSKAVQSSNQLGTRKKPSSEKEALGSNTFMESRQDVQTNACALKRQQILDNVQTDSRKSTLQASLGDAETSNLVCERNRERKRTAQAFPHHESSEEGESASAQPPTERKKSKGKRPLSKASNAEAVPSSSKAKTTVARSSSQEEQSLRGVASKQVRQDVQTSGHASKEQHTLDNSNSRSLRSKNQAYGRANPQAGRPVPEGAGGISSLGDAETSRPVCEWNAKRKKTVQALRHHEPSEKGESTSAQPPTEKRKSKKKWPSSEASNAEAVPSSSRAKTILTRSSSQEEQSFWGVASKQVRQDVQTSGHASNEQHTLDNSNSRSLRSRNQAYGRTNPQAGRPVPEGAGGISSLRDAETSRPVCEWNAKRKKTVQALRHHEPSEKGESTSAQPPTEKRKSKKKWPSSEASNAEAVPSSSRAKTILTRSSSQEEQSFWGVASQQVRQDVQTSGHASNEQHTLDNSNSRSLRSRNQAYGRTNPQAGRPVPEGAGGISSLRDAETSSPVCERNAKRKKTAQALRHHEPSEKGESTSAQPPTEKRKSKQKQPSSEASNAEAVPSSSRAKTTMMRSSSQEQPFRVVASKQVQQDVKTSGHTSNEEHTSSGSLSFTLRSRNQADGRANPRAGRSISESAAGTTSQPPQPLRHKMDWEKLRTRPRHHPKRKFGPEPIFVLEDTESSHRTTSPSSGDEVDASLPLSPIPVRTLPEGGHAGKLGFHWYEATFGALREHAKVAELERSDDDIKPLHWVSDTEWPTDAHQTEDDDSSDVSSDDDFVLPWDKDRLGFSGQSSRDQEPGQKTDSLDHWQKDARRKVQAYLRGVRVTRRAWETIYQWQDHFLKIMGNSLEAMAQRVGHDRIEEEDVVWYIHRYLGTADPYKLWALADELLPAELRQRLYPATPCLLSSKSPK
ncbi:uncharacterized protein [Dermacentor andersoni]|uniref:uncharacterized protein n=1 Tax=Dermacentor andersoni TaxID=34620 RepID=UPI0024171688|nr:serine/arginine repetitive matrix protein 2-like [Dermacentor andersoni]